MLGWEAEPNTLVQQRQRSKVRESEILISAPGEPGDKDPSRPRSPEPHPAALLHPLQTSLEGLAQKAPACTSCQHPLHRHSDVSGR